MARKWGSFFLVVILMSLCFTAIAGAQKKGKKPLAAEPPEKSGPAVFPVSCKKTVQKSLDSGVALLHAFSHEEAERLFTSVIETDPNCAMGYWGIAISRYPLLGEPDPATLKKGSASAKKAKMLPTRSDREKEYIAAVNALYQDYEKVDRRARALSYEKAMETLHRNHPDDREGTILYALSVLAAASPEDKSQENQKKAVEILTPILAEAPTHPGVLHYLIHATDSPERASEGLPFAQAYAKLAPSMPHALHMPSHLFTRLGLWQEAIDSNLASEAAAKRKMKKHSDPRLHALDYLAYLYLQRGEEQKVQAIVKEILSMPQAKESSLTVAYARAAIPARYVMERRRWGEARALPAFPSRHLYTEAITYFARTVGAVRNHRNIEGIGELEVLRSVRDKLVKSNEPYWANQAEILLQAAAGWVEYAEGKNDRALLHLRAAVEIEEVPEKHTFSPGPILPAREMLGDLLLEVGEPEEAFKEYERSLARTPNRFNSLYGAARAAELSEDFKTARIYYEKVLAAVGEADGRRREVSEAKVFLEKRGEAGGDAAALQPAADQEVP